MSHSHSHDHAGATGRHRWRLAVAFVLVAAVNIPQAAWLNLSGALLALGVVGAVASGVTLGRH